MTQFLIENKDVVVPGEKLVEGMDVVAGPNTYRDGEAIYSERLGLAAIDGRTIKLIPLSGRYVPKKHDVIIGKVFNITMNGWQIETNSAYSAVLNLKEAGSEYIPRGDDLTKYFCVGDFLVCGIVNVTSQKLVDVTMKGQGLFKLRGGRIFTVSCNKVPRIIGKQGSMVSILKQATGCKVIVGQNGMVWVSGDPAMELVVQKAISKIEQESHLSGLTEKISAFLERETGNKVIQGEADGV